MSYIEVTDFDLVMAEPSRFVLISVKTDREGDVELGVVFDIGRKTIVLQSTNAVTLVDEASDMVFDPVLAQVVADSDLLYLEFGLGLDLPERNVASRVKHSIVNIFQLLFNGVKLTFELQHLL